MIFQAINHTWSSSLAHTRHFQMLHYIIVPAGLQRCLENQNFYVSFFPGSLKALLFLHRLLRSFDFPILPDSLPSTTFPFLLLFAFDMGCKVF